ncbi:amidohydrolase [Pelobium manganitolerans]|uniref:Amidohydrolase n=1 Tax=Pelobium manganitolerans TaxID=1842495 RepID=A0A419S5V1_9SPHI|nr:amidohydrolase family protein [Pelobium manganitolerans]RKD16221.1 amidohydrolase [Pelobium manganitolerans]
MRIDSHHHFWIFDPVRDAWINDEMQEIKRDFLPSDLEPVLKEHGFDGCVSVQADQSEAQNDFLLGFAKEHPFIKGIVGWVDLQSNAIEERLAYYAEEPLLKGFRHVLQGEAQRDFMLRPAFKNGISLLGKYGFTYDILIFPDQLKFSEELVKAFPNQKFVIDHIAKPEIKNQKMNGWDTDIRAIAQHENVFCKVSGMVTEADFKGWKPQDFEPYLDVIFQSFGTKRLMYGSDWPVCNVAGGYTKALNILENYTEKLSENEKAQFFGANAVGFYNL